MSYFDEVFNLYEFTASKGGLRQRRNDDLLLPLHLFASLHHTPLHLCNCSYIMSGPLGLIGDSLKAYVSRKIWKVDKGHREIQFLTRFYEDSETKTAIQKQVISESTVCEGHKDSAISILKFPSVVIILRIICIARIIS